MERQGELCFIARPHSATSFPVEIVDNDELVLFVIYADALCLAC